MFGFDSVRNYVKGLLKASFTNKGTLDKLSDSDGNLLYEGKEVGTTYESKSATSGGTDLSLVTTGEKYTWNNKYSKPPTGIPKADLASGVIPTSLPANNVTNYYDSLGTAPVSGQAVASALTGDKSNAKFTGKFSVNNDIAEITGTNGISLGDDNTVSGSYAYAIGRKCTASGNSSKAMGYDVTASGQYATALGQGSSSYTALQRSSSPSSYGQISYYPQVSRTSSGSSYAYWNIAITLYFRSSTTASNYTILRSGAKLRVELLIGTASTYYDYTLTSDWTVSSVSSGSVYSKSLTISSSYYVGNTNNLSVSGVGINYSPSDTMASGNVSLTSGFGVIASNYGSVATGHLNATMSSGGNYNNTSGTALAIGNGTSASSRSNAFSVSYTGVVKSASTMTAETTADYAEFFEWLDENPNKEDRVGKFVTLDGDKIRIATKDDDYILGIISGAPFVLGNGDCDVWTGMFLRDEFRRKLTEPAPKREEVLDEEGNPTGEVIEVEGEYEGTRFVLNPDYDYTRPYVSRFDRAEWSAVGMLGVLPVIHDGTAKVNGYVTVNEDGTATACDKNTPNSYRVIKENSDKVIEIIFR